MVFVALLVLFLVTGGKAYYVAGRLPPCFWRLVRSGSRASGGPRVAVMGVTTAVGIGVGMLVALPLLPPSQMSTLDATGQLGETVGWPELVDQVNSRLRLHPG